MNLVKKWFVRGLEIVVAALIIKLVSEFAVIGAMASLT